VGLRQERSCLALLRTKPVDTIATDDVLAVLKPIWTTKAETASRVRGRIKKVLDAAKAKAIATHPDQKAQLRQGAPQSALLTGRPEREKQSNKRPVGP
jgi:integrase-like protein